MTARTRGPDDLNGARTYAYLVAEKDRHIRGSLREYRDLEAAHQDSPIALFFIQDILLFLGESSLVATNAHRFLDQRPLNRLPWTEFQRRTLRYLADELQEGEYLKSIAGRAALCNAYWWMGLKHLSRGDRDGARGWFEKSVETRAFVRYSYRMSRVLLERLKTPGWPPWIPPPATQ